MLMDVNHQQKQNLLLLLQHLTPYQNNCVISYLTFMLSVDKNSFAPHQCLK